jgi:RNA polymerase sigma-70 factor (ECF subfamily)
MAGASASFTHGWQALTLAVNGIEPVERAVVSPAPSFLDGLRRGDQDVWRRLFEDESPAIYRYAYSRLGSREDAEDVTNLVFAEAWNAIARYRDEGLPVRAWLFGIARRIASRHRARFMARNAHLSIDALQLEGSADAVSVDQVALAQALASLDAGHAEVLSLRFIHGLSLMEVAVILKTSVDGVKGRQKRGLEALRRQLGVPALT